MYYDCSTKLKCPAKLQIVISNDHLEAKVVHAKKYVDHNHEPLQKHEQRLQPSIDIALSEKLQAGVKAGVLVSKINVVTHFSVIIFLKS